MNEQIKVGDLAMVVRGHLCAMELLGGVPFKVLDVRPRFGEGWHCNRCGADFLAADVQHGVVGAPKTKAALPFSRKNVPISLPISWLKRIPPLSELEGEKRDERIPNTV